MDWSASAAFLQGVDSVYDIEWAPGVKYSEVRLADEVQFSVYNFEMANVDRLWRLLAEHEAECKELLGRYDKYPEKHRFPVLAAYDQVLKCSHLFNLLDARGAISVTERVGVIKRVRDLAVGTAKIWADQQAPSRRCRVSLDFLLEIGTEEIPHWMIPGALGAAGEAGSAGRDAAAWMRRPAAGRASRRCCRSARRIASRSSKVRRSAAGDKAAAGLREEAGRRMLSALRKAGELLRAGQEAFPAVLCATFWPNRCPAAILGIQWPKTMYWTDGKTARASSGRSAGSWRCWATR